MTNKFHLSSIALLLGGVAMSGCATQQKQMWSPELEQAREAYQQVQNDPVVSSLASAEIEKAGQQLQQAEDASDYFKGREAIAHEATIATLKTLEAKHTARALVAKENIRLAQAGLPPKLLANSSPVIAAATPPAYDPMLQHSGRAIGGSSDSLPSASLSETQQIAQQLAALSTQLMQLQARIEGNSMQYQQPAQTHHDINVMSPAAVASDYTTSYKQSAIEPVNQANNQVYSNQVEDTHTEPRLGQAMPAPDTISFAAAAAPKDVMSDSALREELRAMNARPSSRGMALTLGDRYFETGSARLWNGRAGRHLDNIASVLVENPDLVLEVEAHTDNAGTDESKDNLTADRAISIKSALVLRGVSAARINTTGYGDSAPIADNNTQLGRLQNRRVEIIFPNIASL